MVHVEGRGGGCQYYGVMLNVIAHLCSLYYRMSQDGPSTVSSSMLDVSCCVSPSICAKDIYIYIYVVQLKPGIS